MEKKRSVGVTIFGWLAILTALLKMPSILTLNNKLISYQAAHIQLPHHYYYFVQSYNIITFVLFLILGIGLLKLLRWTRVFYLVVITIAYPTYFFVYNQLYYYPYTMPYLISKNLPVIPIDIIRVATGFLWIIFIFYYFTRPNVKEQFGEKGDVKRDA